MSGWFETDASSRTPRARSARRPPSTGRTPKGQDRAFVPGQRPHHDVLARRGGFEVVHAEALFAQSMPVRLRRNRSLRPSGVQPPRASAGTVNIPRRPPTTRPQAPRPFILSVRSHNSRFLRPHSNRSSPPSGRSAAAVRTPRGRSAGSRRRRSVAVSALDLRTGAARRKVSCNLPA